MKLRFLFIVIACIAASQQPSAQEIVACSPGNSYWYIPDGSHNYTVNLYGEVLETEHPSVINVEDKALHYLIVAKEPYTVEEDDNTEQDILIRFATKEADHTGKTLGTSIEPMMQIATYDGGPIILLWHFAMPEGKNAEVERQYYANIIIGDNIFGLGSPQFIGMDPQDTQNFLLDTLASLREIPDKKDLCK